MTDIEKTVNNISEELKSRFGENLIYIGLQGSYARGEAEENSDIDLVVILNELNFDDLKIYRSIIEESPEKDKLCGFISGKKEIQNWSKPDLFQFYNDTKNIYGELNTLITPPSDCDIKLSIKRGCENLYHAGVHSYLHSEHRKEDLKNLYKSAFFILRAKYYLENKKYVSRKSELSELLTGREKDIMHDCINTFSLLNENESERLYKNIISFASDNMSGEQGSTGDNICSFFVGRDIVTP